MCVLYKPCSDDINAPKNLLILSQKTSLVLIFLSVIFTHTHTHTHTYYIVITNPDVNTYRLLTLRSVTYQAVVGIFRFINEFVGSTVYSWFY